MALLNRIFSDFEEKTIKHFFLAVFVAALFGGQDELLERARC